MLDKTVVQKNGPVTKDEFHAALCLGLSRAAQKVGGVGQLANKLDMTTQGLGKVFAGSLPCIKRLFDALEHDDHLLDDVAALYKRKIVPKVARSDRLAPTLVALLKEVVDAEADGAGINHVELLEMEPELRDADKMINAMLHRIAELKKQRVVA